MKMDQVETLRGKNSGIDIFQSEQEEFNVSRVYVKFKHQFLLMFELLLTNKMRYRHEPKSGGTDFYGIYTSDHFCLKYFNGQAGSCSVMESVLT